MSEMKVCLKCLLNIFSITTICKLFGDVSGEAWTKHEHLQFDKMKEIQNVQLKIGTYRFKIKNN